MRLNAHHGYAYLFLSMGRSDEATAQAKRAAELDPLNLKNIDTVGVMFREAQPYDLAVELLKEMGLPQ